MSFSAAQIAYCSNVHPGEDITDVLENIRVHFAAVKNGRGLPQMASGLWLSAKATKQLIDDTHKFDEFTQVLGNEGVRLSSLNGFPYGDFHQKVVKQQVYLPTWAELSRLEYTQQLAIVLANCLPDDVSFGAISTLPIAYASNWTVAEHRQSVVNFVTLAQFLKTLEEDTGKRIVVSIEMEPDCVLQSTTELTAFFKDELIPYAESVGVNKHRLLRYIGCCYDTCHQGVMGEDIRASLQAIHSLGIVIAKIQVSNALTARVATNEDIEALTQLFSDEKFLHQTKVFSSGRQTTAIADLNREDLIALLESASGDYCNNIDANTSIEARIHYHIPINHAEENLPLPNLGTTQRAILTALDFVSEHLPYAPHLEIETYTWLNLLSKEKDKKLALHSGLIAEFDWLEQALFARNLLAGVSK
ncbi:xylose isomerase [Agaribacter marinus]|uniref:Xylose isomerase n=2 Tax=Agaribacter marinus TaxID=1431249 RepID=A0AA37WL97_9ALTE|nr:xylose isomerase [Agaribacter marinus]